MSGHDQTKLEVALKALARKWGSHSGSCCTFDEQGRLAVTRASCRCLSIEKDVHDVLGNYGTIPEMREAMA